jgi:hypothetical protein
VCLVLLCPVPVIVGCLVVSIVFVYVIVVIINEEEYYELFCCYFGWCVFFFG